MSDLKHQTRRVMKRADYAHSEPKIWMPKEKFKQLAIAGQKVNGKHRSANYRDLAYIMFAEDFSKFYEEGKYDLTIHEAAQDCPEYLLKRVEMIAEYTQLPIARVVGILGLKQFNYFAERISGNPVCDLPTLNSSN